MRILGFDIGGTKCAVVTARWDGKTVALEKKEKMPTDLGISPQEMLQRLILAADALMSEKPEAVGVACGGPLDSERGIVLSPPNLPGWDGVPVTEILQRHYGVPVKLQNDANACAVAEWKFGAGRGKQNLVFLTFGTGLGAGLILGGRLYRGTNDNAGELGHFRLADFGPVGYGKGGSFEGFCSGNGIAQLAYQKALEKLQQGDPPSYFSKGASPASITAKSVAEAARAGDLTALEVYRISGAYLGKGLSMVIDLINPERIVIGGVFARSGDLLWESARKEIEKEALGQAAACCDVVPAELGEQIGDYSAVAAALS